MALSKLSEKCKKCPKVDTCDKKKMELCVYIELPKISASVTADMSVGASMPLLRETMLVNDGTGNMVRVYKDDVEKEIYLAKWVEY